MSINEKALAAIIVCLDIARYDPRYAGVDPGTPTSNRFGAFYLEQSTEPGGYDRWGVYADWCAERGIEVYDWSNQWKYWIYESYWSGWHTAAEYSSLADFLEAPQDKTWSELCWAFIEGNLEVSGVYPDVYAAMCEDLWMYAFRYWDKPIMSIRSYQPSDSENYKNITRGDNLIYWLRDLYHMPRPTIDWFNGSIIAMIVSKMKRRKKRYAVNAKNRGS